MKAFVLAILMVLFSQVSEARSIRPQILPVQPILPVVPIRPIVDDRGLEMVGAVPFSGSGFRWESLDFSPRHVEQIRLRVPNQCALIINPLNVEGDRREVRKNLVQTLNDGQYSYFIYSVNYGRGAEVDTIELGLNSSFIYHPNHGCGVRVWVTEETYPRPYH